MVCWLLVIDLLLVVVLMWCSRSLVWRFWLILLVMCRFFVSGGGMRWVRIGGLGGWGVGVVLCVVGLLEVDSE